MFEYASIRPNKNGHPTPKPTSLICELIRFLNGKLIIDPFMGSGTTAVAAKYLNRAFIGIEISEEYCELAVKRLSQSVFNFNGI